MKRGLLKAMNTRRWRPMRAILVAAYYSLPLSSWWFLSLPYSKDNQPLTRSPNVSSHYNISSKPRSTLYKSSSGTNEDAQIQFLKNSSLDTIPFIYRSVELKKQIIYLHRHQTHSYLYPLEQKLKEREGEAECDQDRRHSIFVT